MYVLPHRGNKVLTKMAAIIAHIPVCTLLQNGLCRSSAPERQSVSLCLLRDLTLGLFLQDTVKAAAPSLLPVLLWARNTRGLHRGHTDSPGAAHALPQPPPGLILWLDQPLQFLVSLRCVPQQSHPGPVKNKICAHPSWKTHSAMACPRATRQGRREKGREGGRAWGSACVRA